MEATKELNIIIVGGTGNGKSTLISTLANLAVYADIETAELSALQLPISGKFKSHDVEITFGSDENERQVAAGSSTKKPKVYIWRSSRAIIRFIDCPGIGDTDGSTVDKEHVANILSCVSRFPVIHGILLVLKSTDNRLTASIKYQLSQILSCFGKRAAPCIRFVLTHAGHLCETAEAEQVLRCFLQSLDTPVRLNSENTFCFENSWFRYLVARRHPDVHFTSEEKCLYAEAYEYSVIEFMRLFCCLFASQTHYSVTNALPLQKFVLLRTPFRELCATVIDELRFLGEEVTQGQAKVQSLSQEIDSNMEHLEENQIIEEFVEVEKQRTVNVPVECEEDKVVYDYVLRNLPKCRVEDVEEWYNERVPREVTVPRKVRVHKKRVITKKEWVNVEKQVVERGRLVTRTVPEWQENAKVEYYMDYEMQNFREIKYETVRKSRTVPRKVEYIETVSERVPRTVKVKKYQEVPGIEKYTEIEPREKVVKVKNSEVEKTIERLNSLKSCKERTVEQLLEKYKDLKTEIVQILQFNRMMVRHMREEALVCLEDDAIEPSMDDLVQFEDAEDINLPIEDLMTILGVLHDLQHTGKKVSEAVENCEKYKSTTFDTVEMEWGYLFDILSDDE